MADRTVAVKLMANVGGFVTGMKTAQRASRDFATRGMEYVQRHDAALRGLSTTAGLIGTAMVGAFGLASKAAIDWESAWTGVLKTVDGSPEQLAALEDQLREMARTMPATHKEIAGVAEAAGQLGVATEDVADFTETMIQLGSTTNLSAEEAATSLARISNIMGSSSDDVSRMGATIVELGNNSATTEREIVDMSTRLAAAGRQAGLSEADLFAIASTMTSVGVEAEAGGTAMSKVFTAISDAARDGGDDLDTFAQVAGVTAEEFQQKFGEDAAGAIGMFVTGMGRMSEKGESTSKVFEGLGLNGERLKRSVLSAGSATELWADQLGIAGQAWDDNSAHLEEYMKRVDTAESQITIAWNGIKDAAIDFGAATLPILSEAAQGVSALAQKFGELPGPVQTAISMITGGGGLVLLGIAGMGKLTVGVNDTRLAMKSLGISAKTAGLAVGGVTAALGIAAFALSSWAQSAEEARAKAEAYQSTLDELGGTTEDTMSKINSALSEDQNNWFESMFNDAESAIDKAKEFGITIDDMQGYIVGEADAIERVNGALDGYIEKNNTSRRDRKRAKSETGAFIDILDGEADALTDAEKAAYQKAQADAEAGVEQDKMSGSTKSATERIEQQTDALNENNDAAREAAGVVLSVRDSQRRLESAVDAASEAYDKNGKTLDVTTEKGRRNQAALDDIASSGWDVIKSMRENGATQDELQGTMESTRGRFIDAARQFGLTADEANNVADEMGLIPDNVHTDVSISGSGHVLGELGAIYASTENLDGKSAVIRTYHRDIYESVRTSSRSTPNVNRVRASGGPVSAATSYLVGEHGPEMFTPFASGSITNHGSSRSKLSGADVMTGSGRPQVNVSPQESDIAVYVQSPVDGSFVRSQAKVVVDGALAGVTRDMANTSTGGF